MGKGKVSTRMQPQVEGATVTGIDHVQMAMLAGGASLARAFYGGILGLREIAKPETLAGRGGVWFQCGEQQAHLGVDPRFVPQHKGHPALLVADVARMRARLAAAGAPVIEDELLPGYERIYTFSDPFGNRLELLRPVSATPVSPSTNDASDESNVGARQVSPALPAPASALDAAAIKARVRENFGRAAEAYVASRGHAHGSDLQVLLDWAAPQPADHALDVSTGGGHTALALAPHVARVTASDLTPRMLAAAHRFLARQGVTNAEFVIADAERLPFLDASFELVTVRIALHHYADVRQAVRDMVRALVPGGRLALIDNIAPEEPSLDEYMNKWEQWRDPSHVRAYRVSEWQSFLADAGLRVEKWDTQRKTHAFSEWVERMQMPSAAIAALEADMLGTPDAVRERFGVAEDAGLPGHVLSWSSDFLIALARKPGSHDSPAHHDASCGASLR